MFYYAKTFTPLLNTKHFRDIFGSKDGSSVLTDEKGLLRALETIVFPGTKLTLESQVLSSIVQVSTQDYPYKVPLFADLRFLEKTTKMAPERTPKLPTPSAILNTLSSLLGHRYLWGGNCLGVEELLTLYPPKKPPSTLCNWQLKGFDCSGLMYYASNGFVPRNTSSWVHFGHPVAIEDLSLPSLCSQLHPLDAIVWKGHILFLYDSCHTIESKEGQGVVLTDLSTRLYSLLQEQKTPKNTWQENVPSFVIRRWHPQALTSGILHDQSH